MAFGDCINDSELAHELLKALPVGRRVYQPSTGRHGFIVNQQDHNMAPDGTYAAPWHECFHQQMNWKITLEGDESFHADMFPKDLPLQQVLEHSYLHWAPTCYRGASFYCHGDSQLPKCLRDNPHKIYHAKQAERRHRGWEGMLHLDCPYTIFLTSDKDFNDPLFLGNTFWPGAPNLPCMFDYDVRHPPSQEIIAQLAQLIQHFAVTDYDASNTSKIVDTIYKGTLQRCLLRGLDFETEAASLTNDDIPAAEVEGDADLEDLVDLAMRAHAAEVAAGVFSERVAAAEAAAAEEAGAAAELEATDDAERARLRRKKAGSKGGPAKLPVVDELKFLNQLSTKGFEMPAAQEASTRSGIVQQFCRGKDYLPRPEPSATGRSRVPQKLTKPSRIWALDLGRVQPRLSRRFRKDVRLKGWKAVLAKGQRLAGKGDATGSVEKSGTVKRGGARKAAAAKKAACPTNPAQGNTSDAERVPHITLTCSTKSTKSAPRSTAAGQGNAQALGSHPTETHKQAARPNAGPPAAAPQATAGRAPACADALGATGAGSAKAAAAAKGRAAAAAKGSV